MRVPAPPADSPVRNNVSSPTGSSEKLGLARTDFEPAPVCWKPAFGATALPFPIPRHGSERVWGRYALEANRTERNGQSHNVARSGGHAPAPKAVGASVIVATILLLRRAMVAGRAQGGGQALLDRERTCR